MPVPIHEHAIMDAFIFDLNSVKVSNTSHKRLFEADFLQVKKYFRVTTDEKMILIDDLISCAIIIAPAEQVRFLTYQITCKSECSKGFRCYAVFWVYEE